jgi:hypothetical protein
MPSEAIGHPRPKTSGLIQRRHTIFAGKKRGPTENRGPLIVKVINLQRGTAETTELGGKPSCCISYNRYALFLTSWKTFFVQYSYAATDHPAESSPDQ